MAHVLHVAPGIARAMSFDESGMTLDLLWGDPGLLQGRVESRLGRMPRRATAFDLHTNAVGVMALFVLVAFLAKSGSFYEPDSPESDRCADPSASAFL